MNGRRLVTIGHGYSAGFLTRRLVPEGWTVTGTTRDGAAKVAAAGADPLRADAPKSARAIGREGVGIMTTRQ